MVFPRTRDLNCQNAMVHATSSSKSSLSSKPAAHPLRPHRPCACRLLNNNLLLTLLSGTVRDVVGIPCAQRNAYSWRVEKRTSTRPTRVPRRKSRCDILIPRPIVRTVRTVPDWHSRQNYTEKVLHAAIPGDQYLSSTKAFSTTRGRRFQYTKRTAICEEVNHDV